MKHSVQTTNPFDACWPAWPLAALLASPKTGLQKCSPSSPPERYDSQFAKFFVCSRASARLDKLSCLLCSVKPACRDEIKNLTKALAQLAFKGSFPSTTHYQHRYNRHRPAWMGSKLAEEEQGEPALPTSAVQSVNVALAAIQA